MKETVKERLIRFLENEGIPRTRFEKSIGVSNGYLLKLRGTPKLDKLNRIIEKYPQLNKMWLLAGEGSMLNGVEMKTKEEFYGAAKREKINMILKIINHYTSGDKELFAKLINVSVDTVETWISRGNFDVERIYDNCNDLSAIWLLTGEGNMFYNDNPKLVEVQKENILLRSKILVYEKILKEKGIL